MAMSIEDSIKHVKATLHGRFMDDWTERHDEVFDAVMTTDRVEIVTDKINLEDAKGSECSRRRGDATLSSPC